MPLEFPRFFYSHHSLRRAAAHQRQTFFWMRRGSSPPIPCFAGITSHAVEARDLFQFVHNKKNRLKGTRYDEAMGCEARLRIQHWDESVCPAFNDARMAANASAMPQTT
jgi:hypothetical protein